MISTLVAFGQSLRIFDIIDFVAVYVVVYRATLLIRGTRAVQMLSGVMVLGIAYFLSIKFELFALNWILANFFDYLIIILVILFQDDLRRALTRVGMNPFGGMNSTRPNFEVIEEIVDAADRLSRSKTGAIIVLERSTGLKNYIDTGIRVDARVRWELVVSVFDEGAPAHDGAAIISHGRLAAVGCFLRLSQSDKLDKRFGTRHRAALGLSEETDAMIIVVSEETGFINLFSAGNLQENLSSTELRTEMMEKM